MSSNESENSNCFPGKRKEKRSTKFPVLAFTLESVSVDNECDFDNRYWFEVDFCACHVSEYFEIKSKMLLPIL